MKQYIKSKIAVIIFLLILILLTLGNSVAAVKVNPSINQFCLDRGNPFDTEGNYTVGSKVTTNNGQFSTLPPTQNRWITGSKAMLAYVLSERGYSSEFSSNTRENVPASEYQVAIWALTSVTYSGSHDYPAFPKRAYPYLEQAAQLYADAMAYYKFLEDTSTNNITISAGDDFGIKTFSGSKYVGPFKITYKHAISKPTGTDGNRTKVIFHLSDDGKTGHYGNIVEIKLSDGSDTKTINSSNIYYQGSGTNTFASYPASGKEFYLPISGLTEAASYTISVKVNNKYRNAEYRVLKSQTTLPGRYFEFYSSRLGKNIQVYPIINVEIDSDGNVVNPREVKMFCTNCMDTLTKNYDGRMGNSLYYCPYCATGTVIYDTPIFNDTTGTCHCGKPFVFLDQYCESCGYSIDFRAKKATIYDRYTESGRDTPLTVKSQDVGFQHFLQGGGSKTYTQADKLFYTYPKLKVTPVKMDQSTSNVIPSGYQFSVTAKQNEEPLTIDSDNVITPKGRDNITVTIKETTAPTGYFGIQKEIKLTFTYDSDAHKWKRSSTVTGWTSQGSGVYEDGHNRIKITDSTGSSTTVSIYTVDVYNIPKPPIQVEITKIDKSNSNNKLAGAVFNIVATQVGQSNSLLNTNVTTGSNGIASATITPVTLEKVTVTIKETTAPTLFYGMQEEIKLEFTYDYTNYRWKKASETKPDLVSVLTINSASTLCKISITVQNKPKPDIVINLTKKNTIGQTLQGAKFKVTATQVGQSGNIYQATIPSNGTTSNGAATATIVPVTLEKITVTIEEAVVPLGHIGMNGVITLVFTYLDDPNYKWKLENSSLPDLVTIDSTTSNHTAFTINITVQNKPKTDLNLYKKDDLNASSLTNGNPVAGALFKVETQNLQALTNPVTSTPNSFEVTTDSNGMISFQNLEFKIDSRTNTYLPIILTLTELDVPRDSAGDALYRLLHGPITITITYNQNAKPTVTVDYHDEDVVEYEVTDDYVIKVWVRDIPIIHLGGKVFVDEPYDIKPVYAPDGNMNHTDEGLAGVNIYLYKEVKDDAGNITLERVEETVYNEATSYSIKDTFYLESSEGDEPKDPDNNNSILVYTSGDARNITKEARFAKGEFLFPNLPKLKGDLKYYVYYRYDGVNYKTTILPNPVTTTSNVATESVLTVDSNDLRTTFNARYQLINSASTANKYFSINQGNIIERNLSSLSEGTTESEKLEYDTYVVKEKLYKSKLKTTYDYDRTEHQNGYHVMGKYRMFARTENGYNQKNKHLNCGLMQREVDLALVNDLENATVSINGKTTTYTYNEILNGYVTLPSGDWNTVGDDISAYEEDGSKVDYNLDIYRSDHTSDLAELDVVVTYKIMLNNQSGKAATIKKVIDYYDTDYTFLSGTYGSGNEPLLVRADSMFERETIIDGKGYRKITISNEFTLQPGGREILRLSFRVNKAALQDGDTFRRLILKDEYSNIAEITEYSTEEGLIDRDSAPGNVANPKGRVFALRCEDDSDMAKGLDIKLSDKIREIQGSVWEDNKNLEDSGYYHGNGEIDSGEARINGIKVELYELVPGEELTLRGTTKTDGGKYSFADFIPGDYVVKFTYGYEDTPENKVYNGQDFKCAINDKYRTVWGNESVGTVEFYNNQGYSNNASVAADCAGRRLFVMSYSTYIDRIKGMILEEKTSATNANEYWEKTNMFAYTQKINVTVDTEDLTSIDSEQGVVAGAERDNKFTHINFGLERRPQTVLILEKHVTALRLVANNGKTILDASADINQILASNNIDEIITGIKSGIQAIKATKTENGYWYAAIDIDELLQGATLEIEYTYVVKNEGEDDYLAKRLVESFARYTSTYGRVLWMASSEDTNWAAGMGYLYLGPTYYTGEVDLSQVSKVGAVVESLQDYINNKLTFTEGEKQDFKKNAEASGGEYKLYSEDGSEYTEKINCVIDSKETTGVLLPGDEYQSKIRLTYSGLSIDDDLTYESYIAQIMAYYNAAGRKDKDAIPGNLRYLYSYDTTKTLETEHNEHDEFWAEKVVITKPTGEDKTTRLVLLSSILAGIGIIAAGAYLIKRKM